MGLFKRRQNRRAQVWSALKAIAAALCWIGLAALVETVIAHAETNQLKGGAKIQRNDAAPTPQPTAHGSAGHLGAAGTGNANDGGEASWGGQGSTGPEVEHGREGHGAPD